MVWPQSHGSIVAKYQQGAPLLSAEWCWNSLPDSSRNSRKGCRCGKFGNTTEICVCNTVLPGIWMALSLLFFRSETMTMSSCFPSPHFFVFLTGSLPLATCQVGSRVLFVSCFHYLSASQLKQWSELIINWQVCWLTSLLIDKFVDWQVSVLTCLDKNKSWSFMLIIKKCSLW